MRLEAWSVAPNYLDEALGLALAGKATNSPLSSRKRRVVARCKAWDRLTHSLARSNRRYTPPMPKPQLARPGDVVNFQYRAAPADLDDVGKVTLVDDDFVYVEPIADSQSNFFGLPCVAVLPAEIVGIV